MDTKIATTLLKRVRTLSAGSADVSESGKMVVYWMYRDQRAVDNWALLRAQEHALKRNLPLVVVMTFRPDLEKFHGTARMWQWMFDGWQEMAKTLSDHGIGMHFLVDADPVQAMTDFCDEHDVHVVVTDFCPLTTPRTWTETFTKKNQKRVIEEVDAHNIVPTWVASPKREFAARTFRPKITKLLSTFLTDFPDLVKHDFESLLENPKKWPFHADQIDWKKLDGAVTVDDSVPTIDWLQPGTKAGYAQLEIFIAKRLETYDEERNDPTQDALSGLSPYLHFGQISAQRVAWLVEQATRASRAQESFLEELIVRRELADNYCWYTPDYLDLATIENWAKKTLKEHWQDVREYTYTKQELEEAKTHDEAWNACQMEMVKTGKMHGYMRMYWAKKILEWTKNPTQALQWAVYLNDRYELDGRDPNGYVGILWAIAGVHDRAWFERPIFGKIRYMNFNGLKRKFDVEKYIEQVNKL